MSTSIPLHQIKVVLLEGIHPEAGQILQQAGYTVEQYDHAMQDDALLDAAADAHIVGIRSKSQLGPAYFEGARRLWAVGCFCIGTNQVDLEAAAARGVAVFNAPFSNTRSVAEKTIAEIIALQRRLFDRSMAMHQGVWSKSAAGAHEVRGLTLGIVGYGRIGSQLSVLAESLGMQVIYHDVVDRLPLGNAQVRNTLGDLLAESDVVSLHVPATNATRLLICERELDQMKPGAKLINNARGSVVDVDALASAIRTGHIGGASIDVFPEEPSAGKAEFDSPLRNMPNVILTPHIGGSTIEAQRNIAGEVSTKLVKLLNNGSTTTAVNMPEVELPMLHEKHHRILHVHHNVPGVLSKMHAIMGGMGVNVAAEHLQSDPQRSYVILDVDPTHSESLEARLKQEVPETIRCRSIW
jgi:D-3-phosphoglycerate dehydrogenase